MVEILGKKESCTEEDLQWATDYLVKNEVDKSEKFARDILFRAWKQLDLKFEEGTPGKQDLKQLAYYLIERQL